MSFFLLLLYVFVTIIRPQDWWPGLYGLPVVDVLSGALIFFLAFESLGRKQKDRVVVPQAWQILLLFVAVLMSHIAHTYFAGLQFSFSDFLPVVVLFYILLYGVNSGRKFKTVTWFMLILIVILVPQGIYQLQHDGYGWAGQMICREGGVYTPLVQRINWIGIFNDPNDLALLFVVAVGFLLAQLFGRQRFLMRLLCLAGLTALFYGIYLTNSRGGLLALIATVYFFMIRRTGKVMIGSILGGVFGFLAMMFGPSRSAMFSTSEASAHNRFELWYQGILMLKSNPLFGVGYDMFKDQLAQTAHNSFVLAAAELGFFGLFCWCMLIYSSFKGLTVVAVKNENMRDYAIGLQSALVGFCAAAFFLSRTYIILPYILFALAGALMMISARENPDLKFGFHFRDGMRAGMLTMASILLAYVFIKVAL